MRANEFVNEGKKAKKLSKTYRSSSTGMDAYVTGSDPYFKYRVGVAAAGSPDFEQDFNSDGPTSAHMIVNPYSSADEDIMNAAIKKVGVTKFKVTSRGSRELESTNTVSPVSDWNKKK
jgi:hypothetical protein